MSVLNVAMGIAPVANDTESVWVIAPVFSVQTITSDAILATIGSESGLGSYTPKTALGARLLDTRKRIASRDGALKPAREIVEKLRESRG
jgi:hypothetical protein